MTFVTPLLLAGTALIGLPIVLHLIMRREPVRLEFPALRFIQQRHDVNRRRLQLQHLLLLLLRAAVIALLVLALARPIVKWTGLAGSQEEVAAVLLFDAAPRMEYRHENQTRLEAARRLGLRLLAELPKKSDFAVLDTRPGPRSFQVDRGAAKQRIEQLTPADNSQPLIGAVEEALRLLGESDKASKELYVFTDLSRAAWPPEEAVRLQQRLAGVPESGIYLIDVGVKEPNNYALGELRLSGQVLSSRNSLRIESELSQIGPPGRRTVELYLLADDREDPDNERKEQKRSEQSFTLKSGESQRVDFRIGGLGLGTHQGLVRIVGQDGLARDDVRFFTVEVKPAWRILVAAPQPARRYALYLTEALAPAVFRKRGQARFDCHVVDLKQLPQRPLEGYAAACLLDPATLEPATWKKLGDYASDGHGVAIFLGRNAEEVDSFNGPHAQQLLPGKLLRQARAPYGDVHLAPRDYEHPVLSEFRSGAGAVPWNIAPVFRYWQLGDLHSGVGVVSGYNDGRPALLERPLGSGRVLTMTTPVSDRPDKKAWNLLPFDEAGMFVILTNRMMAYLVGGTQEKLNYFAGQTAVLRLDTRSQGGPYQLFAPGGLNFPLSADAKQRLLVASSTDRAGNYRIRAGGSTTGVDRGFSVNLAPGQTQLQRAGEEDLARLFGPFEFRTARNRQQLKVGQRAQRVGTELFPYLIVLFALVLAAEHAVANRFYRE